MMKLVCHQKFVTMIMEIVPILTIIIVLKIVSEVWLVMDFVIKHAKTNIAISIAQIVPIHKAV